MFEIDGVYYLRVNIGEDGECRCSRRHFSRRRRSRSGAQLEALPAPSSSDGRHRHRLLQCRTPFALPVAANFSQVRQETQTRDAFYHATRTRRPFNVLLSCSRDRFSEIYSLCVDRFAQLRRSMFTLYRFFCSDSRRSNPSTNGSSGTCQNFINVFHVDKETEVSAGPSLLLTFH